MSSDKKCFLNVKMIKFLALNFFERNWRELEILLSLIESISLLPSEPITTKKSRDFVRGELLRERE